MPARSHTRAADTTSSTTLDEVADELYGLPPEEFTAARTSHEKQARQAGDRELAAAIHRLGKPTIAAWLANQLAREQADELRALPELGANLRQATERLVGDELRHLSRQRHELVYALVQQARQLARATGHPVSEGTARALDDTLQAALADEHAAEQLLAGRLVEPLQRIGDWPVTDAGAPVRQIATPAPPRRPHRDDELRRAEHDLAEAEQALAETTKARHNAEAQEAEADRTAQAAHEQVEALRGQLEEATAAASEADRRRHELDRALRQAKRAVSDAERRLTDAQERRDRQAGGG